MSDNYPPPLYSTDPADWLVYADWLADHCKVRQERRARRIAYALGKVKRLVLVTWIASRFWTVPMLAKGFPSVDRDIYRWWPYHRTTVSRLSCPKDYPDMITNRPLLAWAFFFRVVAVVRKREAVEKGKRLIDVL